MPAPSLDYPIDPLPAYLFPHTVQLVRQDFLSRDPSGGVVPTPTTIYNGPAFVVQLSSADIEYFGRRGLKVDHRIHIGQQADGTLPAVGRNYQILFNGRQFDEVGTDPDLGNLGVMVQILALELLAT